MISLKEILDFEKIFKDEDFEEFFKMERLSALPKSLLIEATSFIIRLSNDSTIFSNHTKLLSNWFSNDNLDFANEINNLINDYIAETKKEITILNPRTSLYLFERILEIDDNPEIEISEPEFEISLFKIYLAINQELNNNDIKIFDSVKLSENYPEFITLAISQSIATFDFSNFNLFGIFIEQTIRTILLFRFLESEQETSKIIKIFLDNYKVNSSNEYLAKLLPIAKNVIDPKTKGNISLKVTKDNNFKDNINFLQDLSTNPTFIKEDNYDFINLRANPLIQTKEDTFLIISPLFIIEKIYNGLYFKLKEINESLPNKDQIKLRNLITYEFSEKFVLYQLLDLIYKKKFKKIRGSDFRSNGAPDYYIRNGNKIFIFESKDILINSEIKESYDYNLYEKELIEKLYFSRKEKKTKPKAVLQLINTILCLYKKSFAEDQTYKPNKIQIYPIIVLHNRQLDILGLNNLINIWFFEELAKHSDKIKTSNIRGITIINIDTLILYMDSISSGKIKIEKIINQYQQFISLKPKKIKNDDLEEVFKEKLISFNGFIQNKHKWNFPLLFKENLRSTAIDEPSA